ncbi:MAG TPA: chemotaxis protein CheB [Nannocystaceae bacterium]|nr:chemotaxis protein CheB [Nannocystaceae bacterium]
MTTTRLIVIGGSAGGLDALAVVLRTLPPAFAVPIAVVLHVRSDRPSLLATVLRDATALPVVEVDDKQPLVPGTIHVGPPNYHLQVEKGGTLSLSIDAPVNFSRPAIDVLFESAADAFGAALVAVLLSGASDDGTRGLVHVVAHGGRALVQDPATASAPTMPAAALATMTPHEVLPPRQLGEVLAALGLEAA